MFDELAVHVEKVIRATLKLGDDVVLSPNSDLVNEIGLDSIEAFEAVATLHELMDVRIPDDIDPKAFTTIGKISQYLLDTYDSATLKHFVDMDIVGRLAELSASDGLA